MNLLDLIGIRKKCQLCGGHRNHLDAELNKTRRYNSYEWKTYHWHNACLRVVLDDPETYGHRIVDLALDIADCVTSAAAKEARAQRRQARRQHRINETKSRLPTLFEDR